jgi:hypothetical protein
MMERFGLARSSRIPVRLASASRNFAAPLFGSVRLDPPKLLGYVAAHWWLRSAPDRIPFPQPPFQVCLRRAAQRMARVSKPNPYEAPCRRQAGAKEENDDEHLSRFLRSLRAESSKRRGPSEGASLGRHRRVPLVVLHCADEGLWQGAGGGRRRKGKSRYTRLKTRLSVEAAIPGAKRNRR